MTFLLPDVPYVWFSPKEFLVSQVLQSLTEAEANEYGVRLTRTARSIARLTKRLAELENQEVELRIKLRAHAPKTLVILATPRGSRGAVTVRRVVHVKSTNQTPLRELEPFGFRSPRITYDAERNVAAIECGRAPVAWCYLTFFGVDEEDPLILENSEWRVGLQLVCVPHAADRAAAVIRQHLLAAADS